MIMQQILNGIASGAVYALFALGFSLIFGVQKILNLAHGGVFMAGAFVSFYAVSVGVPFPLAVLLAMAVAGLLSVLVDMVAIRPLRKRSRDIEYAAIVSTLGIDMMLISLAQQVSDTQVLRFPFGTFPVQFFKIFGLRISLLQVVIFATVIVIAIGLGWYLYRTSFGRQIRAVAERPATAMLLGVNPSAVYFQTFFIAGALAGLTGVLIGLSFNSIHFLMGEPYMLKAFVVVVIGGLGSLTGAVVASLLLGVLQALTVAYLPTGVSDMLIYAILFVVLLVQPNGLFGAAGVAAGVGRK
ncbi:branched-chain amino acid ABC transporter permease [Gemmobacter sp.]|uniref:branched-chain amino acid ABC transporter permease n=1 Tax=Gemmobacter sp. TaxID=1898957 RepID=UPI002AFE92D7|nr:branched-chain amino acid ABC transporter permease [Gemmobacter sp.]